MSFEVVASSRVEERRASSWRLVILTGLELGGTGIALAMVGILSMFNGRPIIVGLLTLGYATLGALFVLAGLIVGYRRAFASLPQLIVGGALAGRNHRRSRRDPPVGHELCQSAVHFHSVRQAALRHADLLS